MNSLPSSILPQISLENIEVITYSNLSRDELRHEIDHFFNHHKGCHNNCEKNIIKIDNRPGRQSVHIKE